MSLIRKLRYLLKNRTGRQGRALDSRRTHRPTGSNQLPRHTNTAGRKSKNHTRTVASKHAGVVRRLGAIVFVVGLISWTALFGWVGDVKTDNQDLVEQVNERLEQTSRLKWLSGAVNLEDVLLSANPQYDDISVSQPLFSRTLTVSGRLKEPTLQWRSGGRTISLSNDGVAIERIETPLSEVPLISDETNLNYQPGDRVASPELVAFLAALSSYDDDPLELSAITLSNSRAVRVSLRNYDFRLLLATDIDPGAQLESVIQLLEQGSVPLRYVDSTVAGRLFWR